jgi:glucose/arabinose dehydrogenase
LGKPETVINSVPCCHHVSRTLAFDDAGLLYVQVGSGSNVDLDSTHSRVVSFDISIIPSGGINWSQGKVFADGMRNEVGLRFDQFGRLWGVENGCDDLYRSDLGGDIHEDNPSEEMNLLLDSKFYGYPFCWSEGKLNRSPSIPGTQWAHPNFMPQISDAFCKDTRNVQPPIYNFPAHNAPMDIIFAYNTGFPADYEGGAFVSFHGSWDKAVPSGYNVRFVYFDYKTNMPTRDIIFFAYNGTSANGPNWPHRPVGLAFVPCSFGTCLLVSSDSSGYIFAIGYNPKSELNE